MEMMTSIPRRPIDEGLHPRRVRDEDLHVKKTKGRRPPCQEDSEMKTHQKELEMKTHASRRPWIHTYALRRY
jgi:hypothetical protein